jgi:hypothetical protein
VYDGGGEQEKKFGGGGGESSNSTGQHFSILNHRDAEDTETSLPRLIVLSAGACVCSTENHPELHHS